MSSRTTDELLEEALAHLRIADEYARDDLSRQMVLDAASLRLAAAVETLSRLDVEVRDDLFGAEWRIMWGMRNRIAHGYLGVDVPILQETLATDLPELIESIRRARRDIAGKG